MSSYGYVWRPRHVAYGWRPYSYGHWVWTDYGWTWISDEEWGWIPFHYGWWGWDDDVGWFWVPGTTWGPAWVSWRYNDLYCGWAPLPPGYEFEEGVGFRALSINTPGRFWIFVQAPHFLDYDIRSRALPYERNMTIINNTTVYNNIHVRNDRVVNEGIGLNDIRRLTKRDVPRYTLRDVERPGQTRISGHEIQMYRPVFRGKSLARPGGVSSMDNAHRQTELAEPKAEIRKRQAEERRLAQQTQAQEIKDMKRRQVEDMRSARDSAEKAHINHDYQSRMSELQRSHQLERQQMSERHQRDIQRPRGAYPDKQEAPPSQARKER